MQSVSKKKRSELKIDPDKPTVLVSACVLGHAVRFDSGHKRKAFVTDKLAKVVNLVPVCPELESGMGCPRETIRLVQVGDEARVFGNKSKSDKTSSITDWTQSFLHEQVALEANGAILQKGSPSCGLKRVKVYPSAAEGASPKRDGVGVFAQRLTEALPNLPVTEDGWLHDNSLRESFLTQVFTDFRFKKAAKSHSIHELYGFHSRHKFLFMAFSPAGQKRLGRLLGNAKSMPWEDLLRAYQTEMITILREFPTRRRYSNALQHMAGYLRDVLPQVHRRDLAQAILDYAARKVGLDVPISLIQHHALRPEAPTYLKDQIYLTPYPADALLEQSGVR